ncbi:MAG TPA: hypothetical protein VM513_10980 [Kofleriaceae bacterium]|nr:hypothetical protein [Kofleriaceae bacterium]
MKTHRVMSAAVLTAALMFGGAASADMSKSVIGAFRGQLVISKGELPEGKNDKETIAKIKAAKLAAITGEAQEDVQYWNFHYTAFLSKTGATKLKLEFYNGKQLAADKTLDGVDPKNGVLMGDIAINEDEGLAKGKTYTIKLVTPSNATVAQTTLTMK